MEYVHPNAIALKFLQSGREAFCKNIYLNEYHACFEHFLAVKMVKQLAFRFPMHLQGRCESNHMRSPASTSQ